MLKQKLDVGISYAIDDGRIYISNPAWIRNEYRQNRIQ